MSIKVTWYGHSAFRLDLENAVVLVDPFLSGNPLAPVRAADVPADFIILTHAHGDHLGDTLPIAQRTGATIIASAEVANWAQQHGLRAHGQNTGGGYLHPFGHVKFVRADHSSSFPDGSYGGPALGFVLTSQSKRLYFAGDTALFSDMRLIGDGGIDIAFLPIGDNFTMGPDDSLQAIGLLRPEAAFPIHYNTFPVIQQDVAAWARCVTNDTPARAIVLDPGLSFLVE